MRPVIVKVLITLLLSQGASFYPNFLPYSLQFDIEDEGRATWDAWL